MTDVNKPHQQKRMVIVLVGVFGLLLLSNVVQSFRSKPRLPEGSFEPRAGSSAPISEAVNRSSPEARLAPAEQAEPTAGVPESHRAPTAVAYTATELRDPLVSLLPRRESGRANGRSLDPTHPSGREQEAVSPEQLSLDIEGIIWGGTMPQAIIGGKVYTVGDHVNGARIVSIERGSVTVDVGGTMLQLGVSSLPRSPRP